MDAPCKTENNRRPVREFFAQIREVTNGFIIETQGRTIVIQGDGVSDDFEEMVKALSMAFRELK